MNDEKDFVRSKDMNEWLLEHGGNSEYYKLIKLLKEHCESKNLCNVQNKYKYRNGKSFRIWSGIKRIST